MTQPLCFARIAAALLLLGAFAPADIARAADRRVAVRPLEVYNAPDLEASAPGLQAALAGRLAGAGLQVSTLKAGETPEADWAVRLTLTKVGSRISVDGAAEPVSGRGDTLRAYEISENADGLLPALNAVAAKLRKEMSGAPLPVVESAPAPRAPVPPAAPPVAVSPPVSIAPLPPPVAPSVPSPAPPVAPVPPAPPAPPAPPPAAVPLTPPQTKKTQPQAPEQETPQPGKELGENLKTYRVAPPLNGKAKSVAVSDVDKDGAAEILVLTDGEIAAYRDGGAELALLWRVAAPNGFEPSYLSAGDVDGDGLPEVFVAGLRGSSPFTEVYQWAGGALTHRGAGQAAFLRAVVHPEEGLILLGQISGTGNDLFRAGLRRFAWRDGQYREERAFRAPPAALVTDVDWLQLREGPPLTVLTTQSDKLRIFEVGGKAVYDGTEEVKGSENVVSAGEFAQQDLSEGSFFRIQGKTLAWRDSGGARHLLLQKNHAFTTLFHRARSYSQGQVLAYRWQALTLVPAGESPKIPGWLADLDLGPSPNRPGATTLYGVLAQSEGILSTKYTARLLAWDL